MKKIFLLSAIILAVFVSSCKKDDDTSSSPKTTYPMVVQIMNGYFTNTGNYGYVILHNLDGTEVVDFVKVNGDTTIDFGKLSQKNATISIVKYVSNSKASASYSIDTYVGASAGTWKFGYNIVDPLEYKGKANFDIFYPDGEYEFASLESTGGSKVWTDVTGSMLTDVININKLQRNNKISSFASVYENDIGYCNWEINSDFTPETTNDYSLSLDKTMIPFNLNSNLSIFNSFVRAYWDDYFASQILFYSFNADTKSKLYLPNEYPADKIALLMTGELGGQQYSVEKYFTGIDEIKGFIDIQDYNISYSYNSSSESFTDINISSACAYAKGQWSYLGIEKSINFNVYGEFGSATISKPNLPSEIKHYIGDEYSSLAPSKIEIMASPELEDFDAYINRYLISPPANAHFTDQRTVTYKSY
jgi:hypothetical protein